MKKFLIAFISIITLYSCDTTNDSDNNLSKKSGGTIKMNLERNIVSLYPPNIEHFATMTVSSQIYEGLVKFNSKTMELEPALAKSWESNDNYTSYTFKLRQGVYFHETKDFKARPVTAEDVKNCFTELAIAKNANFYAKFLTKKILGAEDYVASIKNGDQSIKEIEGIKILNDSTIKIDLTNPFNGFERLLTIGIFVIYPTEIFKDGDYLNLNQAIGTGPFKIKSIKDGEAIELVKNENYWKKDIEGFDLPYLDGISFTFNDKQEEINKFKNKELDLIKDIPIDQLDNILPSIEEAKAGNNADFNYLSSQGLDVKLMYFNHKKEVFQNLYVRQAFNYAIDRQKLVDSILLGDRNIASHGLVPKTDAFGNFEVKGYNYNPEKAKELLTKAGYPEGKGFPEITFHTIKRSIDSITVYESAKMINETLGIKVNVNSDRTIEELFQAYNDTNHDLDIWRYNWIADYADPENFLQLFYGGNSSGYSNETFKTLFEQATIEPNIQKRYELFSKADQALIDDAAFIPLLYNDLIYLTNKNLKNFHPNPIDYRDLREVYFAKKEQ